MTLRAQIEYWKHRAEIAEAKVGMMRSKKWPTVRKAHLKIEPSCQICGRSDMVEVHHITPFHVDKTMELDKSNLITLCEHKEANCHLQRGHLGAWKKFNPHIREEARALQERKADAAKNP